jgi:hypothetical protein
MCDNIVLQTYYIIDTMTKFQLGNDKALMKELGNLSEHQLGDPTLKKLREELESNPDKYKGRYMIRDNTLHCRNYRNFTCLNLLRTQYVTVFL